MKQGQSGLPAGPRISVGRAGADAFEQAQHGAELGGLFQSPDQDELGGARIGEADARA
jgi:hypothetical protein